MQKNCIRKQERSQMPEGSKQEIGDAKKESIYRLNLVPGKEERRAQWNLILISDVAVTVDFFHTDMLEKVISIKKAVVIENQKESVKG